ncbi:ankyrin repeat-containing domain protein [Lactarius quietus]|nr:ankyrin repeat-containing domain protein [Lactarius quietus]
MAYFYFDFRDLNKQTCHDLLRSLITQLSTRSSPCCDILHCVYKAHENGTRQPSDDALKECLKEMLRLMAHGPVFIILDAIDECPDSGFPSSRSEVLQLVKELVDLRLRGLHICATSRPEVDIRVVFEPMAFRSVSLHDERGQKTDIADYIRTVCLTVASRPLRVEELAELLAFDFQASSSGGIPNLREDWRWDDQEEAVLSTCSSLIAIVPGEDSRVVQFSHFSVKEYLTSHRLAKSPDREVSRFHIDLEAAHTMIAQACLATLLQLDDHTAASNVNRPPLSEYAAQHWVDHAQFHNVSARIQDGIDDLFDISKPHFAAWHQVYNIDENWSYFHPPSNTSVGTPLYYAAFCGFYDLTERLIMKHPEQVNAYGGLVLAPLLAALSKRHFRAADLLYRHGAAMDAQDAVRDTPLHAASVNGQVDIMRWLLDHSADSNAFGYATRTPMYYAASNLQLDAIQVLLEYNADVNLRNKYGQTPLYMASTRESSMEGKIVDVVQQLLEHGADPNIPGDDHSTALHKASSRGLLEVARLLLGYGAKVDEKDREGRTPFQVAASDELTKLLLEHGAVPQP